MYNSVIIGRGVVDVRQKHAHLYKRHTIVILKGYLQVDMWLIIIFMKISIAQIQEYTVYSSFGVCPINKSCYDLEFYTERQDQYFTSDSVFLFQNGEHYLGNSLYLANVSNVIMNGSESTNFTIGCQANIIITNSSNIIISNFNLTRDQPGCPHAQSALVVNMSHLVLLMDVVFYGRNQSQAVLIKHTSVSISDCSFYNWSSEYGGAANIQSSNVTLCGNVVFQNNIGYYGGALYVYKSYVTFNNDTWKEFRHHWDSYINVLLSKRCLHGTTDFTNNLAIKDGGALIIAESLLQVFEKVSFAHNLAGYNGGALMCDNSTVSLCGNVILSYNIAKNRSGGAIDMNNSTLLAYAKVIIHNNLAPVGGGILAFSCSLIICKGYILFFDNVATYSGGALLLDYCSYINMTSPLSLLFKRNKAKDFGGSIYQYSYHYPTDQCFFRIVGSSTVENITIRFINSTATFGSDIFSKNLDGCEVVINNQSSISGYEYLLGKNEFLSYASPPRQLCLLKNGSYNCSVLFEMFSSPPGKTLNISAIVVGALQISVPTDAIIHKLIGSPRVSIVRKYDKESIYQKNTSLQFSFYTQYTDRSFQFQIYPIEKRDEDERLVIEVFIENCPPGFQLIEEQCTCEENINSFKNAKCDIDSGLIKFPKGHWIKIIKNNSVYKGFTYSINCPAKFCVSDKPIWLNFSSLNLDEPQCQSNHAGVLCAACKENYSLTLGDLDCALCEDKYISLLLVFMAAGIMLVALLLILQINISTGTVNGLILYANLVNIHRERIFPPNTISSPLLLFISWINLDFGISSCFYNGLNYYWYTWLQFVFPLYLWLLTLLVIICSRYFKMFRALLGSNPVAMLATIILFSYTKLLQVSLQILDFREIHYSYNNSTTNVWKLDPTLTYWGPGYLSIATFALSLLVLFLAPYNLLILSGYKLQAYSNRKGLQWLNKLKPFLDAYYAPFTRNGRFWPGLLLFLRACVLISDTASLEYRKDVTLIITSTLFTLAISLSWTCSIYENKYINVLEMSYIFNSIILVTGTYCITKDGGNQLALVYVSISIALLEFVCVLIYHILIRILKFQAVKQLKWIHVKQVREMFTKKLFKVKDIELNEAANASTTTFSLREPLLESL